jgi:tetratricopeptide (TPR) repeat protein
LPRAYYEYSHFRIAGDYTRPSTLTELGHRRWNTSPDSHTFDDLVALANLLTWGTASGETIAASGQKRWDAPTFRQAWLRLKSAYPTDFTRSADAIINWHRREALAYTNSYALFPKDLALDPSSWYAAAWYADRFLARLPKPQRNWLIFRAGIKDKLGQRDAALADYTAALEMAPRDEHLLKTLAALLMKQGEYAKAKEDMQRAMAILFAEYQEAKAQQGENFRYVAFDVFPISSFDRELAWLCLRVDDRTGYRRLCEQLLELSRQIDDRDRSAIAWICVVAPEGFVDPPRILELAEGAIASSGAGAGVLRTHGAALFRADKYDEAAKRLEEALAAQPEFPSAWLFLAMTEHARGRPDEAKNWLEKAAHWIAQEQLDKKKTWGQRVYLDVLLREAQGALAVVPGRDAE